MHEDASLVQRAIKGDDTAFLTLLDLHKEQLYRTAIVYLKNEGEALEAIQETTFRAYRSIKKLREPSYFSTWLVRILLNVCSNELKAKKIHHHFIGQEMVHTDDYGQLEIEEALMFLDEPSREIIVLKYLRDLSISEIADICECPQSTVKTRLYKGLRKLKELMKESGGTRHV
ncbi:sigma-70 family RNA polymerase sigma factor [Pradoshia sp. D12]|uniref:sigma-70 family RNA polymerase sigma factor n=1 Tax=Bacillaceae TaxID=186817 RepID=UPI00112644B9|nr:MULTISPECIES: sigma-70 family RNA polymerase sigma factor [Bacillaceae]QFK70722.1 sigma-70 family RNA polymerase sigma factor [Pradoshia sp. D12]TPF72516.1 sigma-70 family RNA polymerase sigma factor [Bacillus sp. D12]